MAKNLSDMTPEELGKLFPVQLSAPKETWPELFLDAREKLIRLMGTENILNIEHIGSTAIPGILAKDTIDILVQISASAGIPELKTKMENGGFICLPQPRKPPPHMMFVSGYTIRGFVGQAYHVHIRYSSDNDEIYFRDYLIAHSSAAREYEAVKTRLAEVHKYNRDTYTDAKGDFIRRITALAKKETG
ncbi:GrpB family protein [Brucepastera parasyntrophica]|uniref:GrpB family protein n=1 Tax=Brucepastera parasyntrophica TaxID=2880008 RepID=UPI00210DB092|nr:GrpB family protein [Brucepastera parasyntrophica]ULQ60225.1 GrpB family protein [Brucepastera parasyntrophica]